jgi:hypothetical protein
MIIMVVTSLLAAVTILWLQGRFEHADERNALAIVQQYRSPAGVTLPALLSDEHKGRPVQWSTATTSSCFQHITVVASVADKPGAEPTVYLFAVDLNGPSIHPANEAGARMLGRMDTPLPAASHSTLSPWPSAVEASASASLAPSAAPAAPVASVPSSTASTGVGIAP